MAQLISQQISLLWQQLLSQANQTFNICKKANNAGFPVYQKTTSNSILCIINETFNKQIQKPQWTSALSQTIRLDSRGDERNETCQFNGF